MSWSEPDARLPIDQGFAVARKRMTEAQATILARMAAGSTLTQSMAGDRTWSLLEDPFTVFDDVSPRVLLAGGLIALTRQGSAQADRASIYRLTSAGSAALWKWRLRGP